MLRIALIGCGNHSGLNHAASLRQYASDHPGEVQLAAACDLNAERAENFRRTFGFEKACTDFRAMLDSERIDGCVCVMPVAHIVALGTELLKRGMPCTIEKPLGVSIEETRRLAQVARETGTPHMVSVDRRFNPYLMKALTWARGKGAILYVYGAMIRHQRKESDFVWGTGIHAVDALRHIGGDVASFEARSQTPPEVSGRWHQIDLRFASGAVGRQDILTTAGMGEERYEIFGEGFRARVTFFFAAGTRVECWAGGRLEADESSPPGAPVHMLCGAYQETCEFIRAVREKDRSRPTVEDIAPSMEICASVAEKTK